MSLRQCHQTQHRKGLVNETMKTKNYTILIEPSEVYRTLSMLELSTESKMLAALVEVQRLCCVACLQPLAVNP
jgi:hypothetical protein